MDTSEQLRLRYQEALNQLRMHPNLVWTRNSFFLLVHTGLLAVATSVEAVDSGRLSVVLALAGLFLSVIWVWVNWAGQAIQRRWRALVVEFEADLFRAREGEPEIKGPFARAAETTREGTWTVSITTALLVLSFGFLAAWAFLLVRSLG